MSTYRPTGPALETLVTGFEGRENVGYADIKGVPTAGIGHTGPSVVIGKTYTDAQIDAWFAADIEEATATIYDFVPTDIINELPDDSWNALNSFIYNVGRQAFRDPGTGKETNFSKTLLARDYPMVAVRMRDWVMSGGNVVVKGLVNRRAQESALWLAGFATSTNTPATTETVAAIPTGEPAETGVVPDVPTVKRDITHTVGVITGALGTASAAAPEIIAHGHELMQLGDTLKILGTLGAVLTACGIGLMIYRDATRRQEAKA